MRDERDAPPRIMDDHRPLRDPRDDRSPRERDLIRPKAERNSLTHEQQPQAKEISPPPIAPSAPAYGSIVPSRLPSAGEIQTPTGKAPPTGPRALTEERPVSAGHQAGSERGPSVGPSKAASHDGSPPIPTGPRAQQQQQQQQQPPPQPRPSSKQWINPAISGKRVPDSPKLNRSQSFASQHPRPFDHRPASSGSERQNEYGNRPTSSDAKSDAHTDSHLHSLHMAEPGEILPDHVVRETQSARASIDREMRPPWSAVDSSMPPFGSAASIARASPTRQRQPTASPVMQKHSRDGQLTQTPAQTPAPRPKPRRKPILRVSASRINASPKETLIPPVVDQSSDSDEEDMNDYFEMEIQKAEAEIKKLDGDEPSNSPQDAIAYARLMVMAATRLISEPSSLGEIIGMVPEKQKTPRPETPPASEMQVDAPAPGPLETKATADHPSQPLAWSPARAPAQSTAKPSDQSSAQSSVQPPAQSPVQAPAQPPTQPPAQPPADRPARPEPVTKPEADQKAEKVKEPAHNPEPKIEDVEMQDVNVPNPVPENLVPEPRDVDVVMEDAAEPPPVAPPVPSIEHPVPNGVVTNGDVPAPPVPEQEAPVEEPTRPNSPDKMEEDDDATEIDDSDYATIESARQYMVTPPLEDLPVFDVTPWHEDGALLKSFVPADGITQLVMQRFKQESGVKLDEISAAQREYLSRYEGYVRSNLADAPGGIKSRDKNGGAGQAGGTSPRTAPEPRPEGRRAGRFATERDLERVIQASREEEEARREAAARAKDKKDEKPVSKEATIPNMFWNDEERAKELFIDTSGLVTTERLVGVWHVLPPVCNFTEEEEALFEKAYLEFPKQWGRIADQLPKRDFRSCIQYYYLKKKELNLKEKLKKQPKKRKKGRGKARSSALVSELGNGENETEENNGEGENGERRRPRRAAAPTFSFESAATPTHADSDGAGSTGTPGRRANAANKDGNGTEKPEKKTRKRQPKEKKTEVPKLSTTLVPTPPLATKSVTNRSRSNSRAQGGPDWPSPQIPSTPGTMPVLAQGMPPPFEIPSPGMQPGVVPAPIVNAERSPATPLPTAAPASEPAAPPLRPDVPAPSPQSSVSTFEIGQPSGSERGRAQGGASSYWSVSEANDFPALLKSFGTDWGAIAAHMQTKTAVMVSTCHSVFA